MLYMKNILDTRWKDFFLLRNHAEYFSCDLQRTPRMSAWCFSLIMCSLVTSTNV